MTNRVWLIAIILFSILAVFGLYRCEKISNKPSIIYKTDTIIVEKIKIVKVETPSKPVKVYIQSKPDTVYRKIVEKQIITIGTKIEDGKLNIQTIDTLGNLSEKEFEIKTTDKVVINNQGEAEIITDKKALRKAKFKKALLKVVTIGAAVGGFLLGTLL